MLKLLLVVAGGYLLLVAFVYLTQAGMLYLPNLPGRAIDATPRSVGLDYEDVLLETADGLQLHGWFIPGDSRRILLFFHGNAGNISHRLHSIRQLFDLGLSVLIVDYRGYGRSEGKPTEKGLYEDARAAWRYLTEDRAVPTENIVVFGRSLGGSVGSWLAAHETPGALVVESSFTSVPDIGQELYPWLPVRLLSRFRHSTQEHIAKVRCPVLVVHSRDDEIIPFRHGEAIFNAANTPKTFLEIRGGHNDAQVTSATTYLDGLRSFLNRL